MKDTKNSASRRKILQLSGAGIAGVGGFTGLAAGSPGKNGPSPHPQSTHDIAIEAMDDDERRSIVGQLNSNSQFKAVKKVLKDHGVNLHPNNGNGGRKLKNKTLGETARQVEIDAETQGHVDAEAECWAVDLSSDDDIKVTASVETDDKVIQAYSDGEVVQAANGGVRVIEVEKGNPAADASGRGKK